MSRHHLRNIGVKEVNAILKRDQPVTEFNQKRTQELVMLSDGECRQFLNLEAFFWSLELAEDYIKLDRSDSSHVYV